MTADVEQLEFQAEARQLLDLMVHSVYSDKDSFLRELISNASDALDKLRIEAFRNKDLDVDTSDLHIEIEVDKDARTLTIRDNGIGMTRAEVVDLIGTLAKSGTAELRQQLREAKNAAASEELIGQFGIGFYSTFMVADKVELLTRKAGDSEATKWESSGDGTYTIASVEGAPQGTSVTLHLKPEDTEDALHDYTSEWKIRTLVKKYSDFIAWPIRMEVERRTPACRGRWRRHRHHGNRDPQLDEGAVGQAQRRGLGRGVQGVLQAHRARLGRAARGHLDEGRGHLRVPGAALHPVACPARLVRTGCRHRCAAVCQTGLHHGRLRPAHARYLRFIKGVVDAQDLSLNVSREILQQDRQINAIRRRLTKKVLSTIKDLQSERPDDYRTFWGQFGKVLKEGLMRDFDNQETLLEISSFASTHSEDQLTTLAEYVERMKEGQRADLLRHRRIASADPRTSPHLEAFKAKGYEVLLLIRHGRRDLAGIGDRVRRKTTAVGGQGRGRPRHRGGEDGARGRAQRAGAGFR